MTDKRFEKKDIDFICELVDKQFINYYRICNEEMSLGERLIFDNLNEHVVEGVRFVLEEKYS